MIPKRIWLKNFLSFGEPAAEFLFAEDDPLWVLCGPNGVGKSAVFDAITYALYGEHRGGKQKAEQLIRHGANGFEVEFEFEFAEIDYRVRRTRPRKGRTTQHLLKRVDGEWNCVRGNDAAGAVDANDIKEWVTETLGLGYEAFTNSMLLQQGRADKLFSASRDDRIAVLKGIIGFEQFEAISECVHAATGGHEKTAAGLATELANREPVTDGELITAEQGVTDAEAARTTGQESLTAAVQRVGQAREWEKLERQRKELEQQLAEAEQRQKQGRQIREDKAALDDLSDAVPVLEALLKVRGRIAELKEERDAAGKTLEQKTAERDANAKAADQARQKAEEHKTKVEECDLRAKKLAEEIKRNTKFLDEAEAVDRLEAKLKDYPADLDTQIADAASAESTAEQAAGVAAKVKTQVETLLAQAERDQERFADVAVGVTCSHCGQLVTQAHAAKERARLAAEVKSRQVEFDNVKPDAEAAVQRFNAAQTRRKKLQEMKTERDKLVIQRDSKWESLSALGDVASAADLRARLEEERTQKADAETQHQEQALLHEQAADDVARLDKERKKGDAEVKIAETAVRKHETALATAQGEETTNLGRLADQWQTTLPELDAAAVTELAAKRDGLIVAQVAEKFKALEQDTVKRAGWEEQLAQVRTYSDDIPAPARIPETDAVNHLSDAKLAANKATEGYDAAVEARNELSSRKQEHDRLTAAHRDAAEKHRLHNKLDKLLGQAGLQRELVRDAEEQIVAFANETLQHLSDGELALEEDTTPESTKAFDLRVRQAGGEPIGIAFLSGSQRFRAAVSVAFAVGRFASGRARPLEGVIIDEGFGSLDRDGLRTMAEELKRLQRESALRRVILVSHQPEFTDHFSVGYSLAAGENGTTVTPFRR